jgi:hypothetical protein
MSPAHSHTWVPGSRFKWITGRWFRHFNCRCGAHWFSGEERP